MLAQAGGRHHQAASIHGIVQLQQHMRNSSTTTQVEYKTL
jgi:hypothetical protein